MRSPNEWAADPRIEGARRWLSRYQPFIITVLAIALIAAFLPGRSTQTTVEGTASELATGFGPGIREGVTDGEIAAGPEETAEAARARQARQQEVDTQVLTFEEAQERGVELVANCDPETGRIKMPTRFAPSCVQKFDGPNAGETYQGVTEDKIVVAFYRAEDNPAAQAILTAAGVDDSEEEIRQQVVDWGKLYESHYNMWGREVEWHFVEASGSETDDAAGKADAIKVATQIKAFASIGSPNNTYVNELVARGVMCFCTVSLPIETYIKWSPYVWTSLMASTQGYVHRGDYVARIAGKKAQWAYDDVNPTQNFRDQNREFGFIYYETTDFAYRSGAEFFVRYLKDRYGITIKPEAISAYNGYPDIAATQEQARPIIQKMISAGVTSIIFSGDPFGPIFFTQEATRQLYGPEWIITGSALTDTSFFARLYDQDQWSHAFGVSYLAARLPEEHSGAYRLFRWQYDRDPSARGTYAVINAPISQMYNGLHMAGPVLTPETFKAGMYSLPIQGRGGITTIASSYGDKGLWPWAEDPVAADDATEIWWDRNAQGEDEIGQRGRGLYRYVDGGKRYLPGEWPMSNPKAFVVDGTVTIYDRPPPEDQWPCYPSPATGGMDRC